MGLEEWNAALALLGLIAYGVLAGADFGGGIWDLFASGPRRDQQREAIAHAMGPVWEANHVWLIFVLVVLMTSFPKAYADLSIGLFGVFHFVLLGIILRGAAFVFRGPQVAESEMSNWGLLFGAASVMTPVLLGMAVGAVSSGHLIAPDGDQAQDSTSPWFAPVSLTIGALTLAMCAYLAAVYLTNETQGELQEDFRKHALLAGTFVVALSVLVLPLVKFEAAHLWDNLMGMRAAPVLAAGVAAALVSGWALLRRRYRLARFATIAQVSLLLVGWGLGQYPYIIYPHATLHDTAAPRATLRFVLIVTPLGMMLLLPSLWLLFRVFKRPARH